MVRLKEIERSQNTILLASTQAWYKAPHKWEEQTKFLLSKTKKPKNQPAFSSLILPTHMQHPGYYQQSVSNPVYQLVLWQLL